jgi:hypothetical protein
MQKYLSIYVLVTTCPADGQHSICLLIASSGLSALNTPRSAKPLELIDTIVFQRITRVVQTTKSNSACVCAEKQRQGRGCSRYPYTDGNQRSILISVFVVSSSFALGLSPLRGERVSLAVPPSSPTVDQPGLSS